MEEIIAPKCFKVFRRLANGIALTVEAKDIISHTQDPRFICVFGRPRIGKSAKCDQLATGPYGQEVFRVAMGTEPVTGMCDAFGPIRLHTMCQQHGVSTVGVEDCNVFVVDTEGLDSLDVKQNAERRNQSSASAVISMLQVSTLNVLCGCRVPTEQEARDFVSHVALCQLVRNVTGRQQDVGPSTCLAMFDAEVPTKMDADPANIHRIVEDDGNKVARAVQRVAGAGAALPDVFPFPNYNYVKIGPGLPASRVYWECMGKLVTHFARLATQARVVSGTVVANNLKMYAECLGGVDEKVIMHDIRGTMRGLAANHLRRFRDLHNRMINTHFTKSFQNEATLARFLDNRPAIKERVENILSRSLGDFWILYMNTAREDLDDFVTQTARRMEELAEYKCAEMAMATEEALWQHKEKVINDINSKKKLSELKVLKEELVRRAFNQSKEKINTNLYRHMQAFRRIDDVIDQCVANVMEVLKSKKSELKPSIAGIAIGGTALAVTTTLLTVLFAL